MMPPKSMTNDVYLTPIKEIFINPIKESLRAHIHFYITNKARNEMVHNINSLDSSDGRAEGYNPQG